VTKRYGDLKALDEVSFSISGRNVRPDRPDGAGKTTSIRIACGLLHADTGTVRVMDRDPIKQHRAVTADLGYLSQRFSLYGDLSIDENIAFSAEIHGVRGYEPSRERLLEMTQLAPFRSRRADRLSGGMKQKLGARRARRAEPKILILDEPTTGVDPVSRREFWKLLSEFLLRGLTIVMTTPYLDEAERCGRVALLHDGRLLAVDRPEHLQAQLAGELLEVSVNDARPSLDILRSIPDVVDVQSFGDRAHVRVPRDRAASGAATIVAALERAGSTAVTVRPIVASLEDVFIDLIGGAKAAPPVSPGVSKQS
jgi:ABC-2 type transport system ATP-binding protein